jgi:hypothetical protein
MELLRIALVLVQMGTAPSFPDGDVMMQVPLADKIVVICTSVDGELGKKYTDTLHVIKNHPKFKGTKKSYFTGDTHNGYYFLTQIDSTHLYIEDCDYSLLKFMRLKTKENNLGFRVIDSSDNIVNNEALRQIRWDEPVEIKMFEDNQVYKTSFATYTEYWRCGDKADYASKYPYAVPVETSLRKNLSKSKQTSAYDVLTNPLFVFSFIARDKVSDFGDEFRAKSIKTTLMDSKGNEYTGRSIDLNGDNIPDAFWYTEVIDSPVAIWCARLYLNIDGEWSPVWYNYFKEL